MDDQVQDLTTNESPENQEEPWCRICHDHTDYRRKWDTYNRADLDGGSYSEIVEIPHCIDCQNPMLLLSNCRKLCWAVNLLSSLVWLVGLISSIFLFRFNFGSIIGLIILSLLCFLLSRLPDKSRKTLSSFKKAQKEKSMKELLQKL